MSDYPTPTPTRLLGLALAATLLVVLLAGGGWLAWQGLRSPDPVSAAVAPAAAETAPASSAVGFGAPEDRSGVPWGFAQTPQGAAAAAATAVSVTGHAEAVLDAGRFGEIAEVVFAPDEAARQAREVDAARVALEQSGWGDQPPSRRLYHFAPLAVVPVVYSSDPPAASVEVWAVTLIGVGDHGSAVFTTSTVQLTGVDGSWQVAALDTVEGPTPLVDAPPTAPGLIRNLVREAWPTVLLPVEASEP
jgi:hypothetical protein